MPRRIPYQGRTGFTRRALGLNATGPIERDQVLQAYIELALRRYASDHGLARKETAVLIAHRSDLTPEDLRARLGMSKSTMDTHRKSICAKTGFHRVEYAVIAALEEALGRAFRR